MSYEYEMLCGVHSVLESIRAARRKFSRIYISKERNLSRLNEILELAQSNKIEIDFVSADHLDEMSKGVKHQGIIAKATPFPTNKAETELKKNITTEISNAGQEDVSNKFIVVLEGIEDPNNLGAIIRTALCAGVDHIVIPKDRAAQPSPAVSRASAGAMEHADIWNVTNTASFLKTLKKNGVWIAGLDAQGETPLFKADLTGNIVLVVGGEHQGIRPLVKKECDFLLSLPLAQGITSLNASVACGIAMYEVVRQRMVN
ncbi:MAG: 23S rRNA (guanosine(2251)-2'-O)-methyltransferase RlmB [Desulfamplus sp.]|nr:23S rRNA (guanosine(2251)-2'-O)-methyltransferase RlmB [Desulfamplus sp.]